MTRKTYFVIFCGALSIFLALLARTTYKQAFLYTIHPDVYDHPPVLYGLWSDHLSHLLDRRSLLITTSLSGQLAGILFDESLQNETLSLWDFDISTSAQHTTNGYIFDVTLSWIWTMWETNWTLLLDADILLSWESLFLRLHDLSLSASPDLPYLLGQWYTIWRLRKDRWISLPHPGWIHAPEKLLLFLHPHIQIIRETPPYVSFSWTHEVLFPWWYPSWKLLSNIVFPDLWTIYTKSDWSLWPSLPIPDVSHSLTLPDIIDAVGMDSN